MIKTMKEKTESKTKLSTLDLVVVVLSVYVLGALLIDTLCALPPETSLLLYYIDNFICIVFFIDFCVRLYKADNKWKYLKWGWIDLLSSIPAVNILRVGRLLRLIRLLRIIKAFRSTKKFIHYIFRNKAQGAITSALLIALLLIIFCAIAILQVEKEPNSNIKTAEDAIWWAYVTMTTIGYGDKFPITTEGRIIAAILMTAGVGLFGTFTAYVASWFVSDKEERIHSPKNNDI